MSFDLVGRAGSVATSPTLPYSKAKYGGVSALATRRLLVESSVRPIKCFITLPRAAAKLVALTLPCPGLS